MTLITHYIDLDGVSPIVLIKYAQDGLPIKNIYMVPYGENMNQRIKEKLTPHMSEELFVTDLNTPVELYDFYKKFKDYYIFDHHIGTTEIMGKKNVFVDIAQCGTSLFYKWLTMIMTPTTPMDHYVNLVNTYDMWKSDSELWEEAVNLNMVLFASQNYNLPEEDWRRFQMFINIQLSKFDKEEWFWTPYEKDAIGKGRARLNNSIKKAKENMKIRTDSEGRKFALYFGKSQISLVCHDILTSFPELDYIININTYQPSSKESVNGKVSLRSRDIDLTQFREVDGHKLAAGGSFTEDFLTKLWNGDINNIPYQKERSIGTVHSEKK